jgi:hypothetical protein
LVPSAALAETPKAFINSILGLLQPQEWRFSDPSPLKEVATGLANAHGRLLVEIAP